nr:hypothetical protein [Candidatus Gracilibacteria bacterium]
MSLDFLQSSTLETKYSGNKNDIGGLKAFASGIEDNTTEIAFDNVIKPDVLADYLKSKIISKSKYSLSNLKGEISIIRVDYKDKMEEDKVKQSLLEIYKMYEKEVISVDEIRKFQEIIGTKQDGDFGPNTFSKLMLKLPNEYKKTFISYIKDSNSVQLPNLKQLIDSFLDNKRTILENPKVATKEKQIKKLNDSDTKNVSYKDKFLSYVRAGIEITKELKTSFFKSAMDLEPEIIKDWITGLDSKAINMLTRTKGEIKKLKKILDKKLGDITMTGQEVKDKVLTFIGVLDEKESKNEVMTENEKETRKLYLELQTGLSKYYPDVGSVPELIKKLSIHESGGIKGKEEIKLFSGSGTGSWGAGQATRFAYDNDNLGIHFNPFNKDEAILGITEYFLRASYKESYGKGKYKIARALDIYNKGILGTKAVPNEALLNPKEKRKDKHKNPYNYAYEVLKT